MLVLVPTPDLISLMFGKNEAFGSSVHKEK